MIAFPFKRMAFAALGLSGLAAAAAFAAPAKTVVAPYLEYQQVVNADLSGDGDVVTYSTIAAGIDARVETRRVNGQVSYRYERRIGWNDDLADSDVHSGLAQIRAEVAKGVSLDAGALAARARSDGRGPAFGFNTADNDNIAEVYSLYAGPTVSTHVGGLDVGASYRLGYVKVDDHRIAGGAPVARLDRYDSSVSHNANVSVGMRPGRLPVGWTVGAGYVREDLNRLDQSFEGKYVRADVVVPVSPTLAVTAGVGYEHLESSQQDIRRDAAGLPIVTPGGRLVGDPSRPRLLAYEQSGVMWDAGVIYRPSRRTELQARVGRRYGGTSVTGSLSHQINGSYAVSASVYDSVSSFGRLVVSDLSGLPVNFRNNRNPLNGGIGGIGGCVFGSEAGTGGCFDDAFNSINTANFRNRGANILFSGGRGPWSMGVGAGYANRKYLVPANTSTGSFILNGVTDESFTLNGYVGRELSRTSSINFDAYASWYNSGIAGADGSFGTGISASYYRTLFVDRLQGFAAVGLYTTESDNFDSTSASALLGLRYNF